MGPMLKSKSHIASCVFRVNLRHGIKAGKVKSIGETCTACAGTMILEFAALSRLTGEPIFEEKASRAMDVLWSARHRMSNLVGNVLNIQVSLKRI